MYMCVYVYKCRYINIHMYVCMYIYIYTYVCICVYTCLCMYIYIYMYVCIYNHIYRERERCLNISTCILYMYDHMGISPIITFEMDSKSQTGLKHSFAVPVCSPAEDGRSQLKTTSKLQSSASAPSVVDPLKCLHLGLLLLVAGARWAQASSPPNHPALGSVSIPSGLGVLILNHC